MTDKLTHDFPNDIEVAIRRACLRAPVRRYRANFIHTDTGEPTASLGLLSGGKLAIGVYDDLIVGPHNGRWAVFSNRCDLLGLYQSARTLEAGIGSAIRALYRRKFTMRRDLAMILLSLREPRVAAKRRSATLPGA